MEKELLIGIMSIQAAQIHRRIAELVKCGAIQRADKVTVELLYEAVSKAYKEVNALDSRIM